MFRPGLDTKIAGGHNHNHHRRVNTSTLNSYNNSPQSTHQNFYINEQDLWNHPALGSSGTWHSTLASKHKLMAH